MRLGVVIPQGWVGEFHGTTPGNAWARVLEVAERAERLGFDSLWTFDHFQTFSQPSDELTFESFVALSALASVTSRVRLGHLVLSAGFRNPALVAKMIATLDVASSGRAELGIGAGWKEDEWRAYGYEFPPLAERLEVLGDQLEVVTRMLGPGRATYHGAHAGVVDAINLPKGIQEPRVPVMVGGNGPKVTWRLAARYADELNLDSLTPDEVAGALPVIRARCEEIGRDPGSLRVSVHAWWEYVPEAGPARAEMLARYAALGLSRAMLLVPGSATDPDALDALARDAGDAGLQLEPGDP
ncbi:MAG: TIGR03560 family F420-dependent LLM class oxidoreductase [Chloroflexi bacterium]|nr:TIGR03560 family F420-dependent LLM class oxidoreductase [Chloroflexota bacterium]